MSTKPKAFGYICPSCCEQIYDNQSTVHTDDGLAHADCCADQPPENRELVPAPCSVDLLSAELQRLRAEKAPTKRGILVCGQVMGQMLQLGWRKDQLDALEILFWAVRDGDGRVLKNPPNAELCHGENPTRKHHD